MSLVIVQYILGVGRFVCLHFHWCNVTIQYKFHEF